MIRIEEAINLTGAEKFGECSDCGTNKEVLKITFYHKETSQQHSFRLCKVCAKVFISELNLMVQ